MVVYGVRWACFAVFDTIVNVLNWAWVRAWKLEPAKTRTSNPISHVLTFEFYLDITCPPASSSFQARTSMRYNAQLIEYRIGQH
ncbi:hypothetical protein COR50_20265 [Chitinophaga caeni]|uniref:Uncharacterized protein n=1 Tax=Chitinophaga caeni TaxID=2029983 RepID=A0A291QZH8_9BACT|nr:hypothetical protein COR50_20265 [Chitinophaga caeni]